jgi:hypothetical protein
MNETAVSGARRPCKGCLTEVNYESRIARMVEALSAYPEQCVDEHTYEHRMSMCKSCPSLAYDNTCMHCGCFVAVRAKFKDKACPYPGQAKWESVG